MKCKIFAPGNFYHSRTDDLIFIPSNLIFDIILILYWVIQSGSQVCVCFTLLCRQWWDQAVATPSSGQHYEYVHGPNVATLRVKQNTVPRNRKHLRRLRRKLLLLDVGDHLIMTVINLLKVWQRKHFIARNQIKVILCINHVIVIIWPI